MPFDLEDRSVATPEGLGISRNAGRGRRRNPCPMMVCRSGGTEIDFRVASDVGPIPGTWRGTVSLDGGLIPSGTD